MLAQCVYDVIIGSPRHGLVNNFKLRVASSMRRLLIRRANDPLVNHKIEEFTLRVPISHQLGVHQKAYPNYSTNLARIAAHVREKNDDLTFIDIGANVGDTIAILRNEAEFPILAIEGEERFFSILEINSRRFPNVHLVKAFVGEMNEIVRGELLRQHGTASFTKNDRGDHLMNFKRLVDILEENPRFMNSKMIKIDTDGFDCKIIRGARDWLSERKPIIFFEYDPFYLGKQSDDGISVFSTLSLIGYEALLVYYNTGDYMFSVNLANKVLLEEMHEYFSGRKSQIYCDICAFSDDDMDLFEKIRLSEMEYFGTVRGFK